MTYKRHFISSLKKIVYKFSLKNRVYKLKDIEQSWS